MHYMRYVEHFEILLRDLTVAIISVKLGTKEIARYLMQIYICNISQKSQKLIKIIHHIHYIDKL